MVDELVEAGLAGSELLDLVGRLTGLDAAEARALIVARAELGTAEAEHRVSERDRRLVRNEILFRRLNERVASAEAGRIELELFCECSDRECLQMLRIDGAEYEWLRQNPLRFAVLPGHEAPSVEDVVERHHGFVVVEKHAETRGDAEAADPRQ